MSRDERRGRRKPRTESTRKTRLFYYLILTDTKETERNYFEGLRDAIPQNLKRKLVINVNNAKTQDLVDRVLALAAKDRQYRKKCIVFDRDEVPNFDEIIRKAEQHDIFVAWSNPCIEIWFSAYFGKMPKWTTSVECCKKFSELYKKKTNNQYEKAEKKIYHILSTYGDEKAAISLAQQKKKGHGDLPPSEQIPASTVGQLVEEITGKIKSLLDNPEEH